MSSKDWISMGDELRVELDRLESDFALYVHHFLGRDVNLSMHAKVSDHPDDTTKALRRVQLKLNLLRRQHEVAVEDWYAETLLVLRSHGRAKDWPERPWTEDERG